jgi:hypothetical protein
MEDPKSIPLGARGLQRVNKKEQTLIKAHETLVGLSKTAKWGKTFRIAYRLVTTPVGEACMVCTQCGKELSASNPASTFAQHQNCTNGEEQQQSVDLTGSADENDEPSSATVHCGVQGAKSNQATLPQTVPSAATRARVLAKLALFFFATGTAFCRIENEHLVSAFAFLGVTLCSEKSLRTTMLDSAHNEAQQLVRQRMLATQGEFQCITDGWKSRYCQHSAQLMTLVTTLSTSGTVYHKASSDVSMHLGRLYAHSLCLIMSAQTYAIIVCDSR